MVGALGAAILAGKTGTLTGRGEVVIMF